MKKKKRVIANADRVTRFENSQRFPLSKISIFTGSTGYAEAGASHSKKAFKGFTSESSSPNEDIDYNLQTLRNRSRMLYMSAPVATSAIKTTTTNVVGTGLIPNPHIDYKFLDISQENAIHWQESAKRLWDLWAEDKRHCDATGMSDFYDMQKVTMSGALMNGDSFAIIKRAKRSTFRPFSLRIDLVEADLISTPYEYLKKETYNSTDGINPSNENKIYNGVEVDKSGLIVAYHVCDKYLKSYSLMNNAKWTRIPVEGELTNSPNILQISDIERAKQYRGVPFIAQIIEPLLQMRRYTESELMAALVNSFFTAFITTEKTEPVLTADPEEQENVKPEEVTLGPGIINQLQPGENITFGDPKHPNSGFDNFMITLCKLCGASLEIPYEVILKSFTSSYSASRAALIEAWKTFNSKRKGFNADFNQPVWELFIDEAVALGLLKAPQYFTNPLIRKAYLKCRWVGPTQGQLDPVKEVTAEILKNQNGYSTHAESTINLNGGNFDDNVERLEIENPKLNQASNITVNINGDLRNDDKD